MNLLPGAYGLKLFIAMDDPPHQPPEGLDSLKEFDPLSLRQSEQWLFCSQGRLP